MGLSIKNFLKSIFLFLGFNLAIYSITRIFFLFYHWNQLKALTHMEILNSLVIGIRFDGVVVGILTGLVALSFIFLPNKIAKITAFLLVVAHAIIMSVNIVDIELINFVGRRFSASLLFMAGEEKTATFWQFKPLLAFGVILTAVYLLLNFQILKRINPDFLKGARILKKIGVVVFILMGTLILSRGGLQEKPISYVDAKVFNHPFSHDLILNSSFTLMKSFGKHSLEKFHTMDDEVMLSLLNLNGAAPSPVTNAGPNHRNVVVLILESFSREYVNEINTPFFVSLANEGLYFKNSYANARRSVEGMAAIMAGIPSLMDDPYLSSEFSTNKMVSLGQTLKDVGYETSFFHGAQNGSMRFDAFTHAAGFDHYHGKNEFLKKTSDKKDDDGAWGIYDGPFLQYSCHEISLMKQPFLTGIFTISSHVPFRIPEAFHQTMVGTEREKLSPLLKSIYYTDQSLKGFFDCAKQKPWFKDTLFVLMADHTGPALNENSTFKSLYEIPILFYGSGIDKIKVDTQEYAQHIDVLPTVMDLLNIPLTEENHLARSLLRQGPKTIALYSNGHYELVGSTDLSEKRLKAIRQYFSQGLYQNKLYLPSTTD